MGDLSYIIRPAVLGPDSGAQVAVRKNNFYKYCPLLEYKLC